GECASRIPVSAPLPELSIARSRDRGGALVCAMPATPEPGTEEGQQVRARARFEAPESRLNYCSRLHALPPLDSNRARQTHPFFSAKKPLCLDCVRSPRVSKGTFSYRAFPGWSGVRHTLRLSFDYKQKRRTGYRTACASERVN